MSNLETLLSPGTLSMRFQPIVEERGGPPRVHAFECLTRGPAGTNFESADVLFDYARRKCAEPEIDRICTGLAVATAAGRLDGQRLSVNVHASTLGRDAAFVDHFSELTEAFDLAPRRVIVEIVEHAEARNQRDFLASLDALRSRGFAIALDDVGLGHSNFRMIVDCEPDLLKIDRYFIKGVTTDARRAAVVESLVAFADATGSRIVAEGVEDAVTRDFLLGLGVDLLQGYFYARPLSVDDAAAFIRTNAKSRKEHECPNTKEFSSSMTPTQC